MIPSDIIGQRPILALDCGSTNLKAAVFSTDLRRLAERSVPVPYLREDPDRTELDPEALWSCARHLLADTLSHADLPQEADPVLALTSQAQTFALFDRQTGAPLTPFVSWRDGRARAESDEINRLLGDRFKFEFGFPACIPHLMAPKLLRLLREMPAPERAAVRLMTLPGFIAWKWGGINAIDTNLAAMSGLFSIPANTWSPVILQTLDLSPEQLPTLVPTGRPQEGINTEWTHRRNPLLVFAGNDQTAGAYGNDCSTDRPLITLGTALVAYRRTGPDPGPYPGGGIWGPYPAGDFYELVTSNHGCAALDWASRFLAPSDPVGFLKAIEAQMADAVRPLTPSPFFFPHRMGSSAAWTFHRDSGADLGAVLEGIAFELKWLIDTHFPPLPPHSVLPICGGGSRSSVWLQMLASILNRPVVRAAGDALLGAARWVSAAPLPAGSNPNPILPCPQRHMDYRQRFMQWTDLR